MQLAVNEIFGPTFQGEGPSLGRQAHFLRLAMCNLKCTWCDTKYTWDWEQYSRADEVHLMPVEDVIDDLQRRLYNESYPLLVITGGEPMLQHRALAQVIKALDCDIEIETNGTVECDLRDFTINHVWFNVSLKLDNSGNPLTKRLNEPAVLKYIQHDYYRFKFVVEQPADLDEVQEIVDLFGIDPARVWIMPQATDPLGLDMGLRIISEEVLQHGWNLTTRLHVQLWQAQRAR